MRWKFNFKSGILRFKLVCEMNRFVSGVKGKKGKHRHVKWAHERETRKYVGKADIDVYRRIFRVICSRQIWGLNATRFMRPLKLYVNFSFCCYGVCDKRGVGGHVAMVIPYSLICCWRKGTSIYCPLLASRGWLIYFLPIDVMFQHSVWFVWNDS